ncbi:MAG TPA: hypothetical protein VK002_06375 [Rubricoccaceae bacterium]|nr:hypothetical protein [Rubricoccaceae bacterium]
MRFATTLAAFAFALALVAIYLAVQPPPPPVPEAAEAEEEPEELAHLMAFVQRYAEKLYLAGTSDNAALAQFYVEELEETFEEVAAGGYVEAGHDVGELVETVARPALTGVEQALEARALAADTTGTRARFEARFAELVRACNSCHETTAHGYVRIVVPEAGGFPSQDFRPAGAAPED